MRRKRKGAKGEGWGVDDEMAGRGRAIKVNKILRMRHLLARRLHSRRAFAQQRTRRDCAAPMISLPSATPTLLPVTGTQALRA